MTLTQTEDTIRKIFPATANEIAEAMGYRTTSTVYDHIASMRNKGLNIVNDDGTYYMNPTDEKAQVPTNTYAMHRQGKVAQQTITRKANQYFAELEQIVKPRLDAFDPPVADGGLEYNPGEKHCDLVIHITDTHIGDVVINKKNEIEFNTEEAIRRIGRIFTEALQYAAELSELGWRIDTVHVLLGGDIVTNEAIYSGQPWDVDSTVNEQIQAAVGALDEHITELSRAFPSLQIVCQNGNHGEFRVDGASTQANADDFVYSILDYLIRKSEFNNITIVKDEREYYTNFELRGGNYTGHLRHGQKTRGHIGTSSPRDDWQAWKTHHGFDIAFYGHYHQFRHEPLPDGTPVLMGGSIKPPDEYAESISKFAGAMSAIHMVTDESVLHDTRYVRF